MDSVLMVSCRLRQQRLQSALRGTDQPDGREEPAAEPEPEPDRGGVPFREPEAEPDRGDGPFGEPDQQTGERW